MPIRFDAYRMRDGVTPLSEDYFNPVLGDIDTRIAELEAKRATLDAVLTELTNFGLQRIDVLVGPAMAEVNATLEDLRTRRDQLIATIGNIGNLVTQAEMATALEALAAGITKEGIGLGQVDNVSAANLRARALHTGEQPMSSITGLGLELGKKTTDLVTLAVASATTAVAGRVYECDTSAAAFNLTLPAAPAVGDRIGIVDIKRTFAAKPLTLLRNGKNIEGTADDMQINQLMRGVLEYRSAALGWVFYRLFT